MREVMRHTLYSHFKGGLYYVIGEAYHSEDKQEMVVYQSLKGEPKLWVRPKQEFLSEVEDGKVNPTGQKYRFEVLHNN